MNVNGVTELVNSDTPCEDFPMDFDWIDQHAGKYAQALGGRIRIGVSCNSESIHRTTRTEEAMTLTLVVSGQGRISCNGLDHDIGPGMVLFRHPRMDYRLTLSGPGMHRRCFLVLPPELFSLLVQVHPAMLSIPPVFAITDIGKHMDDFLLVYSHVRSSSQEDFFSLLPTIDRYVLNVLAPFILDGSRQDLRLAKAQLEEDFTSSLRQVAEDHGMGYNSFRKRFAQAYGMPPQQYRLHSRVEKAKQLLSMGHHCSQVAEMLSYPDLYSFSKQFKAFTGSSCCYSESRQ